MAKNKLTMKRKKEILESIEEIIRKLDTHNQYSVGLFSGMISGLVIIILTNFYNDIFNLTGNIYITIILSVLVLFGIIHFLIKRPANRLIKKGKGLRKELGFS